MKSKIAPIILLIGLLVPASTTRTAADARKHDIGSGGQATISSSAFGGSVVSSPSLLSDLTVTVNFGEVSPINPASVIKVTVPVAIRSTEEYRIDVSVSAALGNDPNAIQLSDIGFGIQNFRPTGANAAPCAANSVINSRFHNDPSALMTINSATGRAQFPSSLADIGASRMILNGPTLSRFRNIGNWKRDTDNAYAFDVILAVAPQFYSVGTFSVTLTFSMSTGPDFNC